MISAEIEKPKQTEPNPGAEKFQEVLDLYPEIQPLPEPLMALEGDTYESYMDRVTQSEELGLDAGIYMIDPKIGKVYIPDNAYPSETRKIISDAPIDTRGLASNNGFFARKFVTPDGDEFDLAFRPFDPDLNTSVMDDFGRNNIVRHLGVENTQTLGFYIDSNGDGGTISLLDREIRSADTLSTQTLVEGGTESIITRAARELAFIHHQGLTHGDVALRNIATTDEGRVFFIDWGKSGTRRESSNEGVIITRTAEHDVRSLIIDLVDLRPKQDGDNTLKVRYRKEIYDELFVRPYLQFRRQYNDASRKADNKTPDAEFEAEMSRIQAFADKQ